MVNIFVILYAVAMLVCARYVYSKADDGLLGFFKSILCCILFLIGGFIGGYLFVGDGYRPSVADNMYKYLRPMGNNNVYIQTGGLYATMNLDDSSIDVSNEPNDPLDIFRVAIKGMFDEPEKILSYTTDILISKDNGFTHRYGVVAAVLTGVAPGAYTAESVSRGRSFSWHIRDKQFWWNALARYTVFHSSHDSTLDSYDAVRIVPSVTGGSTFLGIELPVYVVKLNGWHHGKPIDKHQLDRLISSCEDRMNELTLAFLMPNNQSGILGMNDFYFKNIVMGGLPENFKYSLTKISRNEGQKQLSLAAKDFIKKFRNLEEKRSKDLKKPILEKLDNRLLKDIRTAKEKLGSMPGKNSTKKVVKTQPSGERPVTNSYTGNTTVNNYVPVYPYLDTEMQYWYNYYYQHMPVNGYSSGMYYGMFPALGLPFETYETPRSKANREYHLNKAINHLNDMIRERDVLFDKGTISYNSFNDLIIEQKSYIKSLRGY